jgi:hypothetical protein
VTGSDVTTGHCYEADASQTLCFSVYNGSFDGARLKHVRLTFPDYSGLGPWVVGCSSQDTYDSAGYQVDFACTAPGTNEVVYEDPSGGVNGITDKATWSFCVDAAIPAGYNGSRYVHWGIDSTYGPGMYGPRDLTGATEMDMCEPLMLTPSDRAVAGCAGVTQTHAFELWNNTASAGTFTLTYRVCSGEGTFTGPATLSLAAGERASFEAALRPDACLMSGWQILGIAEVEGNGYADEAYVAHTVSEFDGWAPQADSPYPAAYGAVVWAVHDGGLWVLGGYYGDRAVQRYDPSSDAWTYSYTKQPQPAIHYAGEGCYGLDADQHEVIVLFPDTTTTGKLQRYDITDDTWDTLSIPAGYPSGGRRGQDVVSMYGPAGENVCYLTGGSTQSGGGGEVRDLWAYYPATSITVYLGSFSQQLLPFNHHASWYVPWVGAEGAICVAGGLGTSSSKDITDSQCYDLATETFNTPNSDLGPLPEPVFAVADGWKVHNGLHQIWLAGGQTGVHELEGRTVYADELTGGFVYGPELGSRTKYPEGDSWRGHFFVHGGIAYKTAAAGVEALAQCPPCLEWDKKIGTLPWSPTTWAPGITYTVETSDTLVLSDDFDTNQPLTLSVVWDASKLKLSDWIAGPVAGELITGTGVAEWAMPTSGHVDQSMSKWFEVLPSTWTTTMVTETLRSLDRAPEIRAIEIVKRQSALWIGSYYDPAVAPGQSAFLTLEFGNQGGLENHVTISNTFPVTAPMVWADPPPAEQDPGGLWARWDVGELPADGWGAIVIEALIDPALPAGATVQLWHGIVGHEGTVRDASVTEFQVGGPAEAAWSKWINGEPWYPGIELLVETGQEVVIVDQIETALGFALREEWDAGRLILQTAEPTAGAVNSGEGFVSWEVHSGTAGVAAITKTFLVAESTWDSVEVLEQLDLDEVPYGQKPARLVKAQPELMLEAAFEPEVVSGYAMDFDLVYANPGGRESRAWIYATFPEAAPFQESVPAPAEHHAEGLWAIWELGALDRGDEGAIAVTVAIAAGQPISTLLGIEVGIYNHEDVLQAEALFDLHVGPPPPPEWTKTINGTLWTPGLVLEAETSQGLAIVDVFTAHHAFNLTETWAPEEIALLEVSIQPAVGEVVQGEGFLEWVVPGLGEPQVITMTKFYKVLPSTWEATVVQELLSVDDEIVEERPVFIVKYQPELWITALYQPEVAPGQLETFTIQYGNAGGLESDVWIRSEFPAEAPFESSEPGPAEVAIDGQTAWWHVGELAHDAQGTISVTVGFSDTLPYSATVLMWDGIFNHVFGLRDETFIEFQVPPATVFLPLVLRDA